MFLTFDITESQMFLAFKCKFFKTWQVQRHYLQFAAWQPPDPMTVRVPSESVDAGPDRVAVRDCSCTETNECG